MNSPAGMSRELHSNRILSYLHLICHFILNKFIDNLFSLSTSHKTFRFNFFWVLLSSVVLISIICFDRSQFALYRLFFTTFSTCSSRCLLRCSSCIAYLLRFPIFLSLFCFNRYASYFFIIFRLFSSSSEIFSVYPCSFLFFDMLSLFSFFPLSLFSSSFFLSALSYSALLGFISRSHAELSVCIFMRSSSCFAFCRSRSFRSPSSFVFLFVPHALALTSQPLPFIKLLLFVFPHQAFLAHRLLPRFSPPWTILHMLSRTCSCTSYI